MWGEDSAREGETAVSSCIWGLSHRTHVPAPTIITGEVSSSCEVRLSKAKGQESERVAPCPGSGRQALQAPRAKEGGQSRPLLLSVAGPVHLSFPGTGQLVSKENRGRWLDSRLTDIFPQESVWPQVEWASQRRYRGHSALAGALPRRWAWQLGCP